MLLLLTEQAVLWIDVVALVVIIGGTVQAVIGMLRGETDGHAAEQEKQDQDAHGGLHRVMAHDRGAAPAST